ncbi:crotonase/enoyl-CoA hydratase family protein [Nocardioides dubius]|uniref:Crotonase/enoyl-CoA hydratase family protein n=1 Tax=Nocardioides dubius TaxID=317019 RepID=A0ABP4EIZ9_9ACTN
MTTAVSDPATVHYQVRNRVAIITIERPEAMNAVNGAVSTGIGTALSSADADPEVRAVVLTGSGRAFCSGADLKALSRGEDIMAAGHPEWGFAGWVQHRVTVPTIAAVNGFALGGGTELVLAADLAVADPAATFGLPEVRRGLIAAAGGAIRLPRQLPYKVAMELALTGASIDAETARDLGLINRVCEPGAVLKAAVELAERIAANAPLAVAETKRVIQETAALGSSWDEESWRISDQAMRRVVRSEDFAEGTAAFAAKRQPQWRGR